MLVLFKEMRDTEFKFGRTIVFDNLVRNFEKHVNENVLRILFLRNYSMCLEMNDVKKKQIILCNV